MDLTEITVLGAIIGTESPIGIKGISKSVNNGEKFCPFGRSCNNKDFEERTCFIRRYTLCCIVTNKENRPKTAKKVQITFISTPSQAIHGRTSPIISVNVYYLKPSEKFSRYTHVPVNKKIVIENSLFNDMGYTGSYLIGKTSNIVFSVDNRLQLYPEVCRHCGCSLNNKRQYFYLNMDLFEESDFKKKFDQFETFLESQIEYGQGKERENKEEKEIENKQGKERENERDKKEYGLKVILKRTEEPWMMINTEE